MLKVNNISTYYGKLEVLKDVSMTIEQGEIIAVIGNNGAGKTTLINTITGLLQPKQGSIEFKNNDITNIHTNKIVELGIIQVPEGREIFSDLTVRENLELGAYARYKKEAKDKILETLENVFTIFPLLKKRERQIAGTLSGGEQQMLAIGRGLMSNPDVMLLDEPSLGLAPLIVEEVFETIKKLNKKGTTFLIVEQNAFAALSISNRAYVLELGKITIEGESKSLLNNEKVQESFLGKKRKK